MCPFRGNVRMDPDLQGAHDVACLAASGCGQQLYDLLLLFVLALVALGAGNLQERLVHLPTVNRDMLAGDVDVLLLFC